MRLTALLYRAIFGISVLTDQEVAEELNQQLLDAMRRRDQANRTACAAEDELRAAEAEVIRINRAIDDHVTSLSDNTVEPPPRRRASDQIPQCRLQLTTAEVVR